MKQYLRLVVLTLAVVVTAGLAPGWISSSRSVHADAANRKVIVVAGFGTNSAEAKELRGILAGALAGTSGITQEDVVVASYADSQGEYVASDTCKGVQRVGTNISQIMASYPGATFDIVGHSLGGFAIARWATGQSDLSRVHSLITIDSPLDLGPLGIAGRVALDVKFGCTGSNLLHPTWCGIPLVSDARCTTIDQLADGPTQSAISDLSKKVPFSAFDCDTPYVPFGPPPCLNGLELELDGLLATLCLAGILDACVAPFVLNVYTDIPGSWRHRDFGVVLEGHDFYTRGDLQDEVASVIQTDLYDDRQIGCPSPWELKSDTRLIQQTGCETDSSTSRSLTGTIDHGGAVSVIYSGLAAGTVQVDSGPIESLPNQDSCTRYSYEQGSRPLCIHTY